MKSGIRTSKGFTLIELLVVIAIIAILAAILFPVFTAAKEKSNQSKCMNNMKQIAVAIMQYADNYNGALPQCWTSPGPSDWHYMGPGLMTWRERIQPYMKSKGVLNCTAMTFAWTKAGNSLLHDTNTVNGGESPYCHYGLACGLTTPINGNKNNFIDTSGMYGFGFTYLSRITDPARTIMVAENKDGDWSVEPMTSYNGWGGPGSFYPYHLRHSNDPQDTNGGGNFTFCDSHVKFMSVDASESLDTTVSPHVKRFTYWIADRSNQVTPMPVN